MGALKNYVRGFKNVWHSADDDEYDDDHEAEASHTPDEYRPERQPAEKYPTYSHDEGGNGNNNGGAAASSRRLRPVAMPMRAREKNIYTLKPKSQDEASIAADYLKGGSAVVMNLGAVDHTNAVRIIDFMSGVCYGLEGQGHAMKLGETIFLFTPCEFEISSDEVDYGENRDFYFKELVGGDETENEPMPTNSYAPSPPMSSAQNSERRSWEL